MVVLWRVYGKGFISNDCDGLDSSHRPNVEGLYGHYTGLACCSCYGLKNARFWCFEAKARALEDLSRFCGKGEFKHPKYIKCGVLEKVLKLCDHSFGFWYIWGHLCISHGFWSLLKGLFVVCWELVGKVGLIMFHRPCMDGLERHLVIWLAGTGGRHQAAMVKA